MADGDAFSRFIDEYGRLKQDRAGLYLSGSSARRQPTHGDDARDVDLKDVKDVLMQIEECSTGAVEWNTYKRYFAYVGGVVWIPIVLGLLALLQGTTGKLTSVRFLIHL